MDFLWVHWFGTDPNNYRLGWKAKRLHHIGFVPHDTKGAFGFLNPKEVICAIVEGAVPVSARVCDFDPRKTCLAELGRARKEGVCGGVGKSKKLGVQL